MITIVMPAYNSAKTISGTIQSILSQTFYNYKLLIIDDGSSDNTLEIIQYYAAIDSRITYISQINSGVSHARNTGIKQVITPYICFIDSDDTIAEDFLERLYLKIVEDSSDIVICNYNKTSPQNSIFVDTYAGKNASSYISKMLSEGMWGVLWNKLFKTNIIRENNILFMEDVLIWEDLNFCLEYLNHNPKISHIISPLYSYVQSVDGITNNQESMAHIESKIKVVENLYKKMKGIYHKDINTLNINSKYPLISSHLFYDLDRWKKANPLGLFDIINSKVNFKMKVINIISFIGVNKFLVLLRGKVKSHGK